MKPPTRAAASPPGRHYPGIAHLMKVRAVERRRRARRQRSAGSTTRSRFIDAETTGRDSDEGSASSRSASSSATAARSWTRATGSSIRAARSPGVVRHARHQGRGRRGQAARSPRSRTDLGGCLRARRDPRRLQRRLRSRLPPRRARARRRAPSDAPPAMRREVDWIDPLTFARELYKNEESRALGDMARSPRHHRWRTPTARPTTPRRRSRSSTRSRRIRAVPRAYGGLDPGAASPGPPAGRSPEALAKAELTVTAGGPTPEVPPAASAASASRLRHRGRRSHRRRSPALALVGHRRHRDLRLLVAARAHRQRRARRAHRGGHRRAQRGGVRASRASAPASWWAASAARRGRREAAIGGLAAAMIAWLVTAVPSLAPTSP